MDENKLVEILAALEHQQWIEWASYLINNDLVPLKTSCEWTPLLVPYEDLTDEDQEKDRVFARKVLAKLKETFGEE